MKSKINWEKVSNAGRILLWTLEGIGQILTFPMSEDFFMSKAAMRKMRKNLDLTDRQFYSAFNSLKSRGYIKTVDDKDFLITPKGLKKAKQTYIDNSRPIRSEKWNGKWYIAVFDVPESRRSDRNAFRSYLKRKGFHQIQLSVFIAPYADLDELNVVRDQYNLGKYVNFFLAETAANDDDKGLREYFGLLEGR